MSGGSPGFFNPYTNQTQKPNQGYIGGNSGGNQVPTTINGDGTFGGWQQSGSGGQYTTGQPDADAGSYNLGGKAPAYTPGNSGYWYGGTQNGASDWEQQYGNLGQHYGNMQAPQGQNPYQQQQMSDLGQSVASQQQLAQFYQGIANGTGPNLAAAQMQAATDQGINAQMAMANSARGPLAAAAAQRQAGAAGVGMMQNAAQQSAQTTIQQQEMAAQAASGLYNNIAGQQLQQQGLSNQWGMGNAQLQLGQNQQNLAGAIGFGGLQQNVAQSQLQAAMQQQQANLQAAGLGQQQGQFQANLNQSNQNAWIGAMGMGLGTLTAFADADLVEPGDSRSGGQAHWTLREEPDFILAKNQRTGEMRKLLTSPLTDREFHQAMARHGAGPLGADDPRRQRVVANDMSLMDQMQAAAGPPNPNGTYTPPTAGGVTNVNDVTGAMAPSPMPSSPLGAAARTPPAASPSPFGHAMTGIGQSFLQRAQGPQPMSIAPFMPQPGTMYQAADLDLGGLRGHYADLEMKRKPKLGSGKRFAAIEKKAAASGARNPAAVAAAAGRKAHGEKAMERYAEHGRE